MSPSTEQRENREFAAEIKFRVDPPMANQIHEWARSRMVADPHASNGQEDAYEITSLYFDTELFDVFHRKGSFGRSKYRIRRYGREEDVFLERKLKTRGLLTKRRSLIKVEGLQQLSHGEPQRGWPGFWFHRRLVKRRLRVVCQINYQRIARVLMANNGPIRLTLDQNIRALTAPATSFDHSSEGMRLSEDKIVLELKYRFQMPAIFKALAEQFALVPEAISKYRMAAKSLGLVSKTPEATCINDPSTSKVCPSF